MSDSMGFAYGNTHGEVTVAVDPVKFDTGTSYSDAQAAAKQAGARLVVCNAIQPASDASSSSPLGLIPVNIQGLVGSIGLGCRDAVPSDFPD